MTVYIVDYDNIAITHYNYEGIANLDAFTREMDELYGEWYDDYADAQEALMTDINARAIEAGY